MNEIPFSQFPNSLLLGGEAVGRSDDVFVVVEGASAEGPVREPVEAETHQPGELAGGRGPAAHDARGGALAAHCNDRTRSRLLYSWSQEYDSFAKYTGRNIYECFSLKV